MATNDFRYQFETLAFAAADTVKTSGIMFSRFGFPFSHLRFTKSGGAAAMTINLGVGAGGVVILGVIEAGAETVLVTALINGVVVFPTLWHNMTEIAAATNTTGATLAQGDYMMALSF